MSRHPSWDSLGIVRVPSLVLSATCRGWCKALDDYIVSGQLQRRVYETPADPEILNDGGLFDHYIADGFLCAELFQHMRHVYAVTADLVAHLTGLDAIASPYERSAVNVNR